MTNITKKELQEQYENLRTVIVLLEKLINGKTFNIVKFEKVLELQSFFIDKIIEMDVNEIREIHKKVLSEK